MRMALPALSFLCVCAAACEPGAERGDGAPTNGIDAPAIASASDDAAGANAGANSVMRPEVADEVTAPPTPPPAPEPLRATIPFGESGAELDDAGRATVDALIARPAFAGTAPIILGGHSDSQGSDADNLAVSRHRAEAVRDYLVEKGVAADRIAVIALGERRPIAPNANADGSDDPEGRKRNRRVEIVVAPPAPAAPAPEPAG